MAKIWLVLKNEFIHTVARRSFVILLVLVPVAGFIVMQIASGSQKGGVGNALTELVSPPVSNMPEGFIDQSGLIKTVPSSLQKLIRPYASEKDAQQALRIGEISAYYIVQDSFLENGKVIYARPDYNPLGGLSKTWVLKELVEFNLLNGDTALITRLNNPVNLEMVSLTQTEARDPGNMLTFFLPYIVAMLFYVVILTSASLMLSSVTREKQNRVIEILMTSVTPFQMLVGKIVALGLAGLLQTLVWSGAGLLLLRLAGQNFNLPLAFQLPTSILVWGAIFFLLGYALYGSLMAGLGALVPNLREASQATTVVILPMIVPLMLLNSLIGEPNGTLSVALSLIPFTSPVSMMTRLAAVEVPIWQVLLSVVLLIVTVYFVLRAVAGMFRAQNLLSGQQFNLKLFMQQLFSRQP